MKNPTERQRVIKYVATRVGNRDFDEAFVEVLDELPAHFQEWVNDLYDNGSALQWKRFKWATRRENKLAYHSRWSGGEQ